MTIQEEFDALMGRCIGPTVSEIQYRESRRFFFAGALLALTEIQRVAALPDDPDGERGAQHMADLWKECQEFGESVKAGRA